MYYYDCLLWRKLIFNLLSVFNGKKFITVSVVHVLTIVIDWVCTCLVIVYVVYVCYLLQAMQWILNFPWVWCKYLSLGQEFKASNEIPANYGWVGLVCLKEFSKAHPAIQPYICWISLAWLSAAIDLATFWVPPFDMAHWVCVPKQN